MPVYEYQCENCSFLFEVKQSFHDNSLVTCPRCRGGTRRIFSPVPILFKGSGFYTTDKHEKKKPRHKHDMDKDMADTKQTIDKTTEHDVK